MTCCAKPNYNSPATILNPQQKEAGECTTKFAHSNFCVGMSWEKIPASTSDYGSFIFKIYRQNLADSSPVVLDPAGEVSVQLWMPSMGHGSSPITVDRLDLGTFRAGKVLFIMPGQWDIRFQIKGSSGDVDQAVITMTY
jgi:hypothetical protein